MRIALCFPACHRGGGVERVIWEAARHLGRNHDVEVLATEAHDLPNAVRWREIVPLPAPRPFSPLTFRLAAKRAVSHIAADVTVSYGVESPPGDVMVVNSVHKAWLDHADTATLRSKQVPGWVRYFSPAHKTLLSLERDYFARSPKALVPCAAQVTQDLLHYYRLSCRLTVVINNGFDPDQFSPARRISLRRSARDALGIAHTDLVLLMVANEWQRKGLGTTLAAISEIRDPSIKLLLVGRTPPNSFAREIASVPYPGTVRWLGPSTDVAYHHAASDIFILPTQYEAFALSIVESLASGLPVITTTVPGAGDLIDNGKNGLTIEDPQDVAGFVAALQTAAKPGMLERWSQASPESVRGLEWPTLMEKFEDTLLRVNSGGPSPP